MLSNHMIHNFLKLIVALSVFQSISMQHANADRAELLEFFSYEACAIGPDTILRAFEAGFSEREVMYLKEKVQSYSANTSASEWLMIPAHMCVIKLPEIESRLKLTDADIVSAFTAVDQDQNIQGCFLQLDLQRKIIQTRGWDKSTAFAEYLKLISKGLISGELAFFRETPLKTPVGIQLLTGKCSAIENLEEIKKAQNLWRENFDFLIRTASKQNKCGEYFSSDILYRKLANELSNDENTNAWIGVELFFVTLGLGWHEGMNADNKGIPRPPLCTP